MQDDKNKKKKLHLVIWSGVLSVSAVLSYIDAFNINPLKKDRATPKIIEAIERDRDNSEIVSKLDTLIAAQKAHRQFIPASPKMRSLDSLKSDAQPTWVVNAISQDVSEKNNINYKSFSFSTSSSSKAKEESIAYIQTGELAPDAGKGKLAVRVNCDFCENEVSFKILNADSIELMEGWTRQFDSSKKRQTTYINELYPGKYILEMNFKKQGVNYIPVTVEDQKISIVTFRKSNPYGKGNSLITFVTPQPIEKWKIVFDNKTLDFSKLKNVASASIIVPAKWYTYTVERRVKEKLDYNVKNEFALPEPGEHLYIYIDLPKGN